MAQESTAPSPSPSDLATVCCWSSRDVLVRSKCSAECTQDPLGGCIVVLMCFSIVHLPNGTILYEERFKLLYA
jgi:hypothetical protein